MRTQGKPAGRAALHAVVSTPTSRPESFTMTGRMVYDTEGHSRAVLTIRDPESDGSVKMELIADGIVIYMRSSQFGSLRVGANG